MKNIYLKILDADGTAAAMEAVTDPVYVYANPQNGRIQRCPEVKAQGILSADGSRIYQLRGRAAIERAVATATVITAAEFHELLSTLGRGDHDPELTAEEALAIMMGGSYETE